MSDANARAEQRLAPRESTVMRAVRPLNFACNEEDSRHQEATSMNPHNDEPRRFDRLVRDLRRYLWISDDNVRTDHSRANRGLYVGGPPVSWRFIVPVVVAGIVLALAIIALGLAPD